MNTGEDRLYQVGFINFDERLVEPLLQGLVDRKFKVKQAEKLSSADVFVCGGNNLRFLETLRNTFPKVSILVDQKLTPSVANLRELARLRVRSVDVSASMEQLVASTANLLAVGFDGFSIFSNVVSHLMTSTDKRNDGKRILEIIRSGETVETGCYLLGQETGSNVKLTGGPFGGGRVVKRKLSVCVSSEIGCSLAENRARKLACKHCLTGVGFYGGSLDWREIVAQVEATLSDSPYTMEFQRGSLQLVPHVSFMGEGEPLNNLDNVLQAMEFLNQKYGLIAFSLSTMGVLEGIRRLKREARKGFFRNKSFQPQYSLHYASQKRRKSFIRYAVSENSLHRTFPAMLGFARLLRMSLVVNIVMIDAPAGWETNRESDADDVVAFLRRYGNDWEYRVKVSRLNLLNGQARGLQVPFVPGDSAEFVAQLRSYGIEAQLIESMGTGNQAGCGNLVSRELVNILPAAARPAWRFAL